MRNFSCIKQNRCVRRKSKLSYGCINIRNYIVISGTAYCVKQWVQTLDRTMSLKMQYKKQKLNIWKILIINADEKPNSVFTLHPQFFFKLEGYQPTELNLHQRLNIQKFWPSTAWKMWTEIHLTVQAIRKSATSLWAGKSTPGAYACVSTYWDPQAHQFGDGKGLKGCLTRGTGQNLQSSRQVLCCLLGPGKCTEESQTRAQAASQEGKHSVLGGTHLAWEKSRKVFTVRRRRERRSTP